MRAIGRRAAVVFIVLMVAAAACSDDGDKTTAAKGKLPDTAAPAGELKVGFTEDQYVLEGPDANLGGYPLNTNVVETLTSMTPDYEVRPGLAERWELRPPNTWRFSLRQGVRFHDGQPFNAQAVKAGLFDRVAERKGGSTILAGPGSAVVVDDHTIDFTPTGPDLRVPEQLVHPQQGVIAPGSDFGQKPVGTGPFRFVEYLPKERIVVERNPDYWGPPAKLSKITFQFYPDASSRLLALEAGDIDFAFEVARSNVKDLESKGFTVAKSTVGAYEALYANLHGTTRTLLADVRLRKAVAYGIDRSALVKGVLDNLATTDQTFVPPASLAPYASTVKGFTHDPSRARALLDEAGWTPGPDGTRQKAGQPLKLKLVSGFPAAEIHRPVPTFVQSQLKEIGIDVEVVERPDSASYQALITSGDGDLYLEQGNQNDANPGFLPVLLFYGGGTGASAPYQSLFAPGARFDQVIAPVLSESDPDKVHRIVAEAMHEAIDEQAAVIPLAGIFRIYGMKKSVQGFVPPPAFLHVRWDTVSIGK